jgi:hypothetical protein
VYKELSNKAGEPYKAWIQLDFDNRDKSNNHEVKQFHENYGYDLKASLSKYAVTEMDGGDKEKALMQSLQKGNIQSIGVEKDGNVSKMFIEANPQFKTVALFDNEMKRVQKENLGLYSRNDQSVGKDLKTDQKQDVSKNNKQKTSKDLNASKQIKSRPKGRSVKM